ncbi:MAG TPA: GAF domain-containing protein, partial [Gemmatimonadales bacterium]|nr:GAF domain-containing protein [Gemmatimonadales bacterium]
MTAPGPLLGGEQALRFLARASDTLAASLSYETTLTNVARLMVPTLADWCAVDLADANGGLRRLAVTHADPAREAFGWELREAFEPDPEAKTGSLAVFRSGQTELVAEADFEQVARRVRTPAHRHMLEQVGLLSYICVPLIARGRTLGVLSLVTTVESGRHYGPADLELVEELARRAAVAVDNALLHQAERDARAAAEAAAERAARLAAASAALVAAHTPADAAAVIVGAAKAAVEADACALFLVTDDRSALRLAHQSGFPSEVTQQYDVVPLDRRLAICEAVRTGKPVLVSDREDRAERFPESVRPGSPLPSGGLIALPLQVRGDAIGTRLCSYRERRLFTSGERLLLQTLAPQCAQALERALLYDGERRAAQALRASESRFRSVVESGMLGIAFWDGSRVTAANDALLDMLGYTREDVATGLLEHGRLTPPEFAERDRIAEAEMRERGSCTPYQKEFLRKDGARIPVLVGGSEVPGQRETVFFVLDLTEQRRAQEQIQTAQRMEAVGRLAGGVAHEINNALQGVIGFISLAIPALPANSPALQDMDAARQAADRAAAITRQLLAFSRQQILRPATLDLNQVVGEFNPMLRQALGADRALSVVLASAPAWVHADRGQLEQVLLNLTLNARDAMEPGGRLSVTLRHVTFGADRLRAFSAPQSLKPGQFVALSVGDTGHGISPDARPRIFEPFFTTKQPGQGTGLGLSVVHGIVRQSGGHIWFFSEPNVGTTFEIILPAATEPSSERPTQAPAALPVEGKELILLVDDETMVREVAGR